MDAESISKESYIENMRLEVMNLTDGLGYGIDKKIIEPIVYLKALGINTVQSCEGHEDRGFPWPWIEIASENEPEERWQGELSEFKKVAQDKGLDFDKLRRGKPEDVYWGIIRKIMDNPETPEYVKWEKENKYLAQKAQELLDDFYAKREVDENIKIKIDFLGSVTRLQSFSQKEGESLEKYTDINNSGRKKELELLELRRKEFEEFSNFLKKKFYGLQN